MKQCVAVLGGELPAASVHQTITESLRWLKQSVSMAFKLWLLVSKLCHCSLCQCLPGVIAALSDNMLGCSARACHPTDFVGILHGHLLARLRPGSPDEQPHHQLEGQHETEINDVKFCLCVQDDWHVKKHAADTLGTLAAAVQVLQFCPSSNICFACRFFRVHELGS